VAAPAVPDLRQRIIESFDTIIPRVTRREIPEVPEDAALMADLGLTSSTMLELLLEVEESLEIEIDVEGIDEDNAGTIGKLADYIVGHLISDE
jgi:acyl carrier protein